MRSGFEEVDSANDENTFVSAPGFVVIVYVPLAFFETALTTSNRPSGAAPPGLATNTLPAVNPLT